MSRRSPWAVLAVLSLIGSLLALSAGPATGRNGEADDRALYSACLGSALEPAGFRDVGSGSVAEDAINCMANYGIMPGTSPGIFQPRLGVTREQMALFLVRAAEPAGIELPRVRNHGFTDIGGLSSEVRDAINQIAELRITLGTTTTTTFSPHRVVNRRQMAQFLTRFLDLAVIGEGGVSVESVVPDDTQFDDIRKLPHDPYDAIRLLYELGVTTGTTATTFSPDQPVTRSQMALFISRMLAHTNARPAGVTMQVEDPSITAGDSVDLVISVRDEDHQPVVDASVDLFYIPEGEDGFASTGRCTSKAVLEGGDTRCVIDLGDEVTDGDGNLFYTVIIEESLEMFAWTGDRGDRFDLDDTPHASLEFGVSKSAENFLVTDDLPEGAIKVPFGRTVTFTFQLVDEDENPVAEQDVEIRIETVEENDGRRIRDRVKTYDTDSSGRVELSFRLTDPDSNDPDRDGELNLDVLRSDVDPIDKTAVRILIGSHRLRWSDDDDKPTTLLLEQSSDFSSATTSGSGGRNRVTATLLDQYGDTVRGKRVHFTSDDEDGLWHKDGVLEEAQNPYRKTTSSQGIASATYTRKSAGPGTEIIYARTEGVSIEQIEHYWVKDAPEGETTTGEVLHHDADSGTVVLKPSTGGPYLVTYDSDDQFNDTKSVCRQELAEDGTCPGNNYDRVVEPERYTDFKEGLEEGDDLTAVIDTDDPDDGELLHEELRILRR